MQIKSTCYLLFSFSSHPSSDKSSTFQMPSVCRKIQFLLSEPINTFNTIKVRRGGEENKRKTIGVNKTKQHTTTLLAVLRSIY